MTAVLYTLGILTLVFFFTGGLFFLFFFCFVIGFFAQIFFSSPSYDVGQNENKLYYWDSMFHFICVQVFFFSKKKNRLNSQQYSSKSKNNNKQSGLFLFIGHIYCPWRQ